MKRLPARRGDRHFLELTATESALLKNATLTNGFRVYSGADAEKRIRIVHDSARVCIFLGWRKPGHIQHSYTGNISQNNFNINKSLYESTTAAARITKSAFARNHRFRDSGAKYRLYGSHGGLAFQQISWASRSFSSQEVDNINKCR